MYGTVNLQHTKVKKKTKEGIKEYSRYFVSIPVEWVGESGAEKGDKLIVSGNPKELKLKVQKL